MTELRHGGRRSPRVADHAIRLTDDTTPDHAATPQRWFSANARVLSSPASGVASACSQAPIDSSLVLADAGRMHTQSTALLSPGEGPAPVRRELEPGVGETDGPREAAATLADIEAALAALDRSCALVASALLPQGDGICDRYRRAAARWPHDMEPPSYERQAALQSALHDAASSVRIAARSCRRARELLGGAGA
jgi:hypothetical protein